MTHMTHCDDVPNGKELAFFVPAAHMNCAISFFTDNTCMLHHWVTWNVEWVENSDGTISFGNPITGRDLGRSIASHFQEAYQDYSATKILLT
jgi:hypothetical protein